MYPDPYYRPCCTLQTLRGRINYGQIMDNLPAPERVMGLLKSINIQKAKLYDADPRVLRAFANFEVELAVGLGNEFVSNMTDQAKAEDWVKANVQAYLPATKITSIALGNEVFTGTDTDLMKNLVPAMQNIHSALVSLGLDSFINVSTAHSSGILSVSYPPSAGIFNPQHTASRVPYAGSFAVPHKRLPFLCLQGRSEPNPARLCTVSTKRRHDGQQFAL